MSPRADKPPFYLRLLNQLSEWEVVKKTPKLLLTGAYLLLTVRAGAFLVFAITLEEKEENAQNVAIVSFLTETGALTIVWVLGLGLLHKLEALIEVRLSARIDGLKGPLKSIALQQLNHLSETAERMDKSHEYNQEVIATSEELRRPFVAIMNSAATYLKAVTVEEFWRRDVMGNRVTLKEYINANRECAERGVQLDRYLFSKVSDINDLPEDVRLALVHIVEATEKLPDRRKRMRLYHVRDDRAEEGPLWVPNFGFWDDDDAHRWFVQMHYHHHQTPSGVKPSFRRISICRAEKGATVARKCEEFLDKMEDEDTPKTLIDRISLYMRPRGEEVRPHWQRSPELLLCLAGQHDGPKLSVRIYDYHAIKNEDDVPVDLGGLRVVSSAMIDAKFWKRGAMVVLSTRAEIHMPHSSVPLAVQYRIAWWKDATGGLQAVQARPPSGSGLA